MKKTFQWKNVRKRILLLVLVMLATLAIVLFFSIRYFFFLKKEPTYINREYAGFRWTRGDPENDDSEPIKICVDGVSTEEEPFQGTIVIEVNGEEQYRYENCRVYEASNFLFVCESVHEEGWVGAYHSISDNYATIAFSEDWSEVLLSQVKSETGPWSRDDEMFYVGPAQTQQEAIAVAKRAAYGSVYEGYDFE